MAVIGRHPILGHGDRLLVAGTAILLRLLSCVPMPIFRYHCVIIRDYSEFDPFTGNGAASTGLHIRIEQDSYLPLTKYFFRSGLEMRHTKCKFEHALREDGSYVFIMANRYTQMYHSGYLCFMIPFSPSQLQNMTVSARVGFRQTPR